MARKLGAHLATLGAATPDSRGNLFAPDRVVILASPLVRCVETAHGIREGLLRTTIEMGGDATAAWCPIFIEHSLVESAKWQQNDLFKNAAYASGEAGMRPLLDPSVDPTKAPAMEVTLWKDAAFHQATTSPHIVVGRSKILHDMTDLAHETGRAESGSSSPSSVVSLVHYCPRDHQLVDTMPLKARVALAARRLLSLPELQDKIVILVGHGLTAETWYNELTGEQDTRREIGYTAFAILKPRDTAAQTTKAQKPVGACEAVPLGGHPGSFRSPHLFVTKVSK